jgi:hypothetical protein
MIADVLFCLLGLRRIGNARSEGCSIDMHAGACAAAWLGGAATSAANPYNSWLSLQLPGGDASRKENARNQRAQQRCLDFLSHGRLSLLQN